MPVRAGRKQPLPGHRPAKQRLEAMIPDITKAEAVLYKRRGIPSSLEYATLESLRSHGGAVGIMPERAHRSSIHTHLENKHFFTKHIFFSRTNALPSLNDLSTMISQFGTTKIRYWHIASIDSKGRVIGYTSMKFLKRFPGGKMSVYAKRINDLKDYFKLRFSEKQATKALAKELEENRFLTMHFTPMQGYKYNLRGMCFVKK